MKTLVTLILLLPLGLSTAFGQYEKIFFKDTTLSTKVYQASFSDIVANKTEVKFKLQLKNLSKEWLVYRAQEGKFLLDGKEYGANEHLLVVGPGEEKSRVIRTTFSDPTKLRAFSFSLKGISFGNLKAVKIEESFKLPAVTNELSDPPVLINLLKASKTTGKTDVKFSVKNMGSNVLLGFPSRVTVKMPDGKSYATENKKDSYFIIDTNETEDLSAQWLRMPGGAENDMQLVDMYIEFNEVFQEIQTKPVDAVKVNLQWNEALTKEKAK